jgi:hypothetical protein
MLYSVGAAFSRKYIAHKGAHTEYYYLNIA